MVHRVGKDAGVITPITGKRKAQDKGEDMNNQDVLDCIDAAGFSIRYNEVTSELESQGKAMTDGCYANIVTAMRILGSQEEIDLLKRERTVQLALDSAKELKAFNPLHDYFTKAYNKYHEMSLRREPDWSPIRDLRNALVVKKEDTDTDDGIDWAYECLKYWLCGAIEKNRSGFQNWMLVIQGLQGCGKSYLARKLGRVVGDQYFHAGPIDPRNKDHIIKRSSTFVWEAEELDGTMNFADMALLKAFLTQDSAKERMPYGRFAVNLPSRCSFIGTVNTETFLKDTTGNRRFLVIKLLKINFDAIEMMDFDLVWGEAVRMLHFDVLGADGHMRVPESITEIQKRVNENSRSMSALEVALDARIKRGRGNISVEQLRRVIDELGFHSSLFAAACQYMADKGFEKKKSVRIGDKVCTGFAGCTVEM
jgi:hypothetical protein